jgi:deoxyribonuclease-4
MHGDALSKKVSTRVEIPEFTKGRRYLLGAHTSIAGGVALAPQRAARLGFTAMQIFVKNNKQWFAPELRDAEIAAFQNEVKRTGLYVFAHNSYLVNLASAKEEVFALSVKSMTAELKRADALGLPFIVMHPGSHGGDGEAAGLKRIVEGLEEIIKHTKTIKTKFALENTAGQGTSLGQKFEHLAWILQYVSSPERFGVCLDTAHLLEAGYDIRTKTEYEKVMKAFEKIVGLQNLLAWHLNDSKTPLGSRVDRHEHLGEGKIGLDAFQYILEDKRFKDVPKVLETPKSEDMREDVENLEKLIPFLVKKGRIRYS